MHFFKMLACDIHVYKTKVPTLFHSKEKLHLQFFVDSPETSLADSNWFFSSFAISRSTHPSQTSQAYSDVGLMKVRCIFDRVCLERVNFSFLRTLTCLKDAFTMLSTWFVQFPSDAKVNPKYLWFFTISKSAQRYKVVEFSINSFALLMYGMTLCCII